MKKGSASITKELVTHVMEFDFAKLPAEVVRETKLILLDSLGVSLAGLATDKGRISTSLAKYLGGPPESSTIGLGHQISSVNAAFANGELMNALDFDMLLFPPGHVSPYVISAPLALAESRKASGADLITALVIGHEFSARIAGSLATERRIPREGAERGKVIFYPAHGCGPCILGGALASAKIINLDHENMASALGIAAYNCPVPVVSKFIFDSPHGAMTKYGSSGWASQTEVTAALLAERGYSGDDSALDGEYGFWRFYASDRWKPERILDGIGKEWRMLRLHYKLFPCCGGMDAALDRFVSLVRQHNLTAEEINEVRLWLDPIVDHPIFQNTDVQSHIDAQFSVSYVFSCAANNINIGADWQDLSTITNQRVQDFMSKVKVWGHPEYGKTVLEDPTANLNKIEVDARGQTFTMEYKDFRGHPMLGTGIVSDEDLIGKFVKNASRWLPKARIDRAIAFILELEGKKDAGELLKLITV